ncbi:MAG: hypothetical protein JSW61_09420 [Candidatus Thorarchaeota archaeon]|nr:MAG: hypothetical protein JSW61_09420 [Candidatus Thorarchaeota archaeon]
MVRQLALKFLYNKTSSGLEPEPYHTSLAMGFAAAESAGTGRSIKSVSFVSIPYWVVQVSESESILLFASGDSTRSLEATENTALSTATKILSTETPEARDIPHAVEKALPMIGNVEKTVSYVKNLIDPAVIVSMGKHVVELEPATFPNRLELSIDSQETLAISEEFQSLVAGARTRISKMDELLEIVKEQLKGKLGALGTVTSSESDRWIRRLRMQEDIEELETRELAEKKRDAQYDLHGKYKLELRALTAEFARSVGDLEAFFAQLIAMIQDSRTDIAQKGDDVEAAIRKFQELVGKLREQLPEYERSVESITAKADSTMKRVLEIDNEMSDKSKELSRSIDSQIRERRHRLVEFRMEKDQAELELESLREKVENSVTKVMSEIEKRSRTLQEELNQILYFTLDNNSINNLAPLTMLDIETFAVMYGDGDTKIFTSGIIPEDRFTLPVRHRPVASNFDEYILTAVDGLKKSSVSFRNAFEHASSDQNLLRSGDAADQFRAGLNDLMSRQLLGEGVKERLEGKWTEYAESV